MFQMHVILALISYVLLWKKYRQQWIIVICDTGIMIHNCRNPYTDGNDN